MHNMSTVPVLNEEDINDTVWEYLENHLGPQYMPTAIVLPITVVYLLIFISGIIGNVIVCLVISRNSNFQTPTNYYIFSLAISDLLILLFGLPNDLKVYWQQYPWELGELVCKLRALIAEMTSYASVLTIVAFTLERYIAICHPLFIQTVSTLPRAIKFITSVWLVSCLSAVPFACLARINYIDYPMGSGQFIKESAYCGLPMHIQSVTRPLLQFATFAFFFLPLTVIIVLYAKISLKLRSTKFARITYKTDHTSSTASGCSAETRKTEIRRSVNKMLIAVVIAFFICWAPFHAQRLLAVYVAPEDWTIELRTVNEVLYYAAGCFYYFSATVNPILYTLMSTKYRVAFREALCSGGGTAKSATNYNTSVFRNHTQCQHSEVVHSMEKETSLRISKQTFEADTTMRAVRPGGAGTTANHHQLSVPGSAPPVYRSFSGKEDADTEEYVYIDPEGGIGDAKADVDVGRGVASDDVATKDSNGRAGAVADTVRSHRNVSDDIVRGDSFKKCLVVSLRNKKVHKSVVDGPLMGKSQQAADYCGDKNTPKSLETCV